MRKNLLDVGVDPERVWRKRRRQYAIANQVGIAAHGAGEIARTLPVYGIGVPDAADVKALANRADQLAFTFSATSAHDHVGRRRAGIGIETPQRTLAQSISAVGRKARLLGPHRPQLLGAMLVGCEPTAVVEIRQQPDQPP